MGGLEKGERRGHSTETNDCRNGGVLSRRCRYRRLAAASEVNGRSQLAAVNTVRIPPQPAKHYDYSRDTTSPSLLSGV
jgi:hypothetical protein